MASKGCGRGVRCYSYAHPSYLRVAMNTALADVTWGSFFISQGLVKCMKDQ